MKVLAIDTACPPGSIALAEDRRGMAYAQLHDARRTAQTFAPQIQTTLQNVGWQASEIELVATTMGPGSFTGLRIGVTAAKTFAYAVGAKAIGINTLEVIASQTPNEGEIEVVLDAQRSELFAARFRRHGNHLEPLHATQVIGCDQWLATRSRHAILTGPGLAQLEDRLPAEAQLADPSQWQPRADTLACVAWEALQQGRHDSVLGLVPQYFRKSAAEEKADRRADA